MTRIVVVGAGLLGASVAHRLAEAGAAVTVLEADRPAGATSGSSFAWVNAQDKAPDAYFELNRAGIDAYPALAAALGGDWYHPGGDLVVGRGPGATAAEERIARHEALDYPVRRIDRAALERLEPALDPGDGELVVGHFTDEAWLDLPTLVGRLLGAARAHGAVIRTREAAASIVVESGRVAGVRTPDGSLPADLVVLAAGNGSEGLAATAGTQLPMAPTPGLLAVTAPSATGIRHVVHAGDVALRPDGGGRLMLQSRGVDGTLGPDVREVGLDAAPVAELLERATRIVPELRRTGIESVRVGVRSVAVDGQPTIGFAPGVEGLYMLVSHSGATLGALLGELVAGELLDRPAPALEPYRPARFAVAAA